MNDEKLSVEQYFDFIHSNHGLDLTISLLNQIIGMHGFRKLYRTHKTIVVDAVNSIDLIDPTRSTLEDEGVSPTAAMTLEEATADLAELKWQESAVTSVETLNSMSEKDVLRSVPSEKKRKRGRKPQKVMRLREIGNSAPAAAAFGGFGGAGSSSAVGVRREKLVPRRKRPWTSVDSFIAI